MFHRKNEYEMLNRMLDDAISGNFEESVFDESELSKLQTKLLRYLSTSSMSEQKIKEERSQLKELITNISHQTKTPLTNVLLYAELLKEETNDEKLSAYADEIELHARKLEQLIQSFVKMSRLETGVFQFDRKKNPIDDLVLELSDISRIKAQEKQIKIVTEKMEQAVACFDRKWTMEAVYNILDNALKYSDCHTTIAICPFQYEMFAGISICDEGMGIREEEIPRIFGRFYRGKGVRDKEGIGVGLYLTREIIEGQGGYIKVSSKMSVGSRFDVFLPRE